MAGGLSNPVSVHRGIRQGYPISGQLYSLAIEPLLFRLRAKLKGLTLPGMGHSSSVVVSAYADDVNIFISNQDDVNELSESLNMYEKASSAKVNWDISEALLVGNWCIENSPTLPGNMCWGRNGIKTLGLFIGNEQFQ